MEGDKLVQKKNKRKEKLKCITVLGTVYSRGRTHYPLNELKLRAIDYNTKLHSKEVK